MSKKQTETKMSKNVTLVRSTSGDKPTVFGQQILDLICDHTAKKLGMGFACWGIGRTSKVIAHVAKKLKKSIKSVAGGVADLIEKEFLSSDTQDQHMEKTDGWLVITIEGWKTYTKFSDEATIKAQGAGIDEMDQFDDMGAYPYPFK